MQDITCMKYLEEENSIEIERIEFIRGQSEWGYCLMVPQVWLGLRDNEEPWVQIVVMGTQYVNAFNATKWLPSTKD